MLSLEEASSPLRSEDVPQLKSRFEEGKVTLLQKLYMVLKICFLDCTNSKNCRAFKEEFHEYLWSSTGSPPEECLSPCPCLL